MVSNAPAKDMPDYIKPRHLHQHSHRVAQTYYSPGTKMIKNFNKSSTYYLSSSFEAKCLIHVVEIPPYKKQTEMQRKLHGRKRKLETNAICLEGSSDSMVTNEKMIKFFLQ